MTKPPAARHRLRPSGALAAVLLLAAGCSGSPGPSETTPAPGTARRESARRHVNLGVAYLAQFLPARAIEEFEAAQREDPDNRAALVNLGIACRVAGRLPEARTWLDRALALDPDDVAAHYNLALVDRLGGDAAAAIGHLERVARLDAADPETRYLLGLARAQQGDAARALLEFDAALTLNPTHASAAYGRGRALLALGRETEAQAAMEASQRLAGGNLSTMAGQQYGEQGVHSIAVEDMPSAVRADAPIEVRFVDVSAGSGLGSAESGTAVALADFDGDRKPDLLRVAPAARGLAFRLHPGHGDLTFAPGSGEGAPASGDAAVTLGDIDNDGDLDAYAAAASGGRLLLNAGAGRLGWAPERDGAVLSRAVPAAALADADHDGDLDLAVGTPSGLAFFRNTGSGQFRDATAEWGVRLPEAPVALLFVDFDLDRDIDLVAILRDGPRLFENRRDGTFGEATARLPAADGLVGAALVDTRRAGRIDLVLAGAEGLRIMDGWSRTAGPPLEAGAAMLAVTPLDFDLDGLVDLAAVPAGGAGLRLLRNLGGGEFAARDALPGIAAGSGAGLIAGDLDGDGDPDLIRPRREGPPSVLRNDGGSAHTWIGVRLTGRASNRAGIGARVAVRAGPVWQHQMITGGAGQPASGPLEVVFGLGRETQVDGLSVLWPGGVLQDEVQPLPGQVHPLQELDRKGSSCPGLFGWDGRRFAYQGDFVGGGVLGLWLAPGVIYAPDPEELHLVRPGGIEPDGRGRVLLRITENLEEVTYLDRVAVQAVDHPEGTLALPREGLLPMPPYPSPDLHLFDHVLEPTAAVDGRGRDWTRELRDRDRAYPELTRTALAGHTEPHALTVTFPAPPPGRRVWLWGHGTLRYANSTPNFAAAQSGGGLRWPALDLGGAGGRFTPLTGALPVPMGEDKPALFELTGRLPPGPPTLRISTNMDISWDRLALVVEAEGAPPRATTLAPVATDLRPLGYPLWKSEDGRWPPVFVYEESRPLDTWKPFPGRYTRFGPVDELLAAADDRFVVLAPGDELALEYDATVLPALPPGWRRTWLVLGLGYVKDGDPHSPASGRVDPMPFAGMGAWPPTAGAYGSDPARALAHRVFNTRVVRDRDPLRRPPTGSAVASRAPGG